MLNIDGRWRDYREAVGLWPTQQFFKELLAKELSTYPELRIFSELDQALAQLEEIWDAPDREALLKLIEAQQHPRHFQLKQSGPERYPRDFQERLAQSLKRLMAAHAPGKMARYKADLAICRLTRLLSPELQREVLEPWFKEKAKHKRNAVVRCLSQLEDLRGLARVLVMQYIHEASIHNLQLVARDPEASALIPVHILHWYFEEYLEDFKLSQDQDLDKGAKFRAMVAAKVMIHGGHIITDGLKQDIPEILCWALTELGGEENEALLLDLLERHARNAEVLWGVIKGAPNAFMSTAYAVALIHGFDLFEEEEKGT